MGSDIHHFGKFLLFFFNWEGVNILPQIRLRKIPEISIVNFFQERLIESHGLQCGFCTPGFVMSMFCLLRNNPTPTRDDVERALEGKLTCRERSDSVVECLTQDRGLRARASPGHCTVSLSKTH